MVAIVSHQDKTLWSKIRPGLLSIRTKLTLPYILLAVLIAVGGGLVVSQVALNSLQERFSNQLIETRKLASDSLVHEESNLLGTLRLIAHTQGIGEAMRGGDKTQIVRLVYPVTFNAAQDAVILLDPQGQPIVTLLRSESTGQYARPAISGDLKKLPFVANVLDQKVDKLGDKYSGISQAPWGDYFFVAGPVKDDAGQFVGALLVGKSLSGLVRQIREETLSQVTVYDLTLQPLTSSFQDIPTAPHASPAALLAGDDEHGSLRDLEIRSIGYTELMSSWKVRGTQEIGLVGIALPKTFLVRTSGITRFNITAITILAILLTSLLGILLAESITRPILKLKRAAQAVSGGSLGVHVDVRGGDEVAVLAQSFNTMVANLRQSEENLISTYDKTIEGWSRALELRDADTMGHSERVVEMALALAREMHVDEHALDQMRRGAYLHDIGKMGIPDPILRKPGSLTADEWKIMKQHPLFARQMLQEIEFLKPAMEIPVFHHERWDGSGYPYGLSGEQIPLSARIFAVIDVWDALISDRPYRKAWTEDKALEYIRTGSGRLFDPKVVRVFIDKIDLFRSLGKEE